MIRRLPPPCCLLLVSALLLAAPGRAESGGTTSDDQAAKSAPVVPTEEEMREIEVISLRIRGNRDAGIRSRADAQRDLNRLAAFRAKFTDPKSGVRAQIGFLEANLWLEVFEDFDRAIAVGRQLQEDFAGTPVVQNARSLILDAEQRRKARATQAALIGKPAPGLTFAWSSRKGLTSLADLRGKVVVLYFWTTWSPQSVNGFPSLKDLAAHYAGADVELVGVTSPQGTILGLRDEPMSFRDNPKGEMRAMTSYLKSRRISWPVVFTEGSVFNPDYGIYRVPTMVVVSADGLVRSITPAEETAKLTKMDLVDAALAAAGRPVPPR